MLRSAFSFLLSLFKSHTQLHLEVLFLRKQLEIVARSSPRLKIRPADRFFMGFLTALYDSWREALLIAKPETVIRWHRQSFRLYWKWKSRPAVGRPKIPRDQIDLIKQMAHDNPLWGAPRIHGELLKLGIDISESTVVRHMPNKAPKTSKQRWKTFLKNHSAQIVSVDFLVVPTITFKLLYVLVFLSHDRRRVIHFDITTHPTAQWSAQQLPNAFSDLEPPRFLLRDRDAKFGEMFIDIVTALGIDPLLTAYKSPWQNGDAERLIGSIRRECLDHLIILNETHLRGILQQYVLYYNTQRTHLGIGKDSPEPREAQTDGVIDKVAVLNGGITSTSGGRRSMRSGHKSGTNACRIQGELCPRRGRMQNFGSELTKPPSPQAIPSPPIPSTSHRTVHSDQDPSSEHASDGIMTRDNCPTTT